MLNALIQNKASSYEVLFYKLNIYCIIFTGTVWQNTQIAKVSHNTKFNNRAKEILTYF